jgi:hypothetical protein
MPRKLTLDLDRLAVHSFDTTGAGAGKHGTVRGEESPTTPPVDNCTCDATCACPSAYYYCNTGAALTHYSCHYTRNASCVYA